MSLNPIVRHLDYNLKVRTPQERRNMVLQHRQEPQNKDIFLWTANMHRMNNQFKPNIRPFPTSLLKIINKE